MGRKRRSERLGGDVEADSPIVVGLGKVSNFDCFANKTEASNLLNVVESRSLKGLGKVIESNVETSDIKRDLSPMGDKISKVSTVSYAAQWWLRAEQRQDPHSDGKHPGAMGGVSVLLTLSLSSAYQFPITLPGLC